MRPAHLRRLLVGALLIIIAAAAAPIRPGQAAATAQPAGQATGQPTQISYWGMNAYFTKGGIREDSDNVPLLQTMTKAAGASWTREELPWDLIEPQDDNYRTLYDDRIGQTAGAGFGIIGMLLTTPGWARDPNCTVIGDPSWCPPTSVAKYAEFAAWMVERYDGDGASDAPGSPRIAAWEIWNEPNDLWLWPNLGSDPNARKQRYGEMMVAAYGAIKAADPTALVLTGGIYVFDGDNCGDPCDGLRFLKPRGNNPPDGVFDLVPAARTAFDVLSIHPYLTTAAPDYDILPTGNVLSRNISIEGRVRTSQGWLADPLVARGDAPIWITEMAWCTTGGTCPAGVAVTEEEQANYLVRSMVIAQNLGVQHTSWFQLEDAFDNPNKMWSYAAILRDYDSDSDSYPVKPAYTAYQTMATTLNGAIPAGFGPFNQHYYDPAQPHGNDNGTYNYRYTRGTAVIDVLWLPNSTVNATFPTNPDKQVTLVQRNGQRTILTPVNGGVPITLSESPIIIIQDNAPQLVAPQSVTILAHESESSGRASLAVSNGGGGSFSWTASAADTWLSLAPASGSASNGAPGIITITAATQGRMPGTYTSQITIDAGGVGSAPVAVELKIASQIWRTYVPLTQR